MPLTAFQKDVLAVLAANRSEESHFAGGILLQSPDDSPRFSRDFDIFHDLAAEVVRASKRDVASLRAVGLTVDTISTHGEWERDAAFRKAHVRGTGSDEVLEIDWATDSAFRFFPIERDAQLGWRLHMFDAATNKALTLAARPAHRCRFRGRLGHARVDRQDPVASGACPRSTPSFALRLPRPGAAEHSHMAVIDAFRLDGQVLTVSGGGIQELE